MAMSDDTIRLILDMGQSGKTVDEVRQKLDQLSVTVKKTADTYEVLSTVVAKGTTALATYAIATDKVDVAMDKLVADAVEQTRAQKAMNLIMEEFNTVAIAAAGERRAGGRGMMGLSYAFQDFTSVLTGGGGVVRALGSITNNIDQLGTSLGLSVTNAAKLSIGFTAFTAALPVLIPMVESFWKSMSAGEKGPEPILTAMDAAQRKLAEIRGEVEKIMAMRPPEEVETKQRVEKAYGGRGEEIIGGLAKVLSTTWRGAKAEQVASEQERGRAGLTEADIERLVGVSQVPMEGRVTEEPGVVRARLQRERQEMKDEIQKRINEANVQAATKIVGAAPADRMQRDMLRQMISRAPGEFPPRLGVELALAEPEVVERNRRQQEQTERNLAANARRVARQQAADREARAIRDAEHLRQVGEGGDEARRRADAAARQRERAGVDRTRAEARRAGAQDIHAIAEAGGMRAVGQLQRQVMEQQGVRISPTQAAHLIRQAQQRETAAMDGFVGAAVAASNGAADRIAVLNQGAQLLRKPPARNEGK